MFSNVWIRAIILATGILVAGAGSGEAASRVTLQAAAHPGYARLAFTGGPAVEEARIARGKLFVKFAEPIAFDTAQSQRALPEYLGAAQLSRGRSILTIALKKPVVLETSRMGNASMVDLVDTAGEARAGPSIRVRFGEHERFDRVVFDWPQRVAYEVSAEGKTARVDFEGTGVPDLSALYQDPPPSIRGAEIERGEDGVSVVFTLTEPADVSHFRAENRVAIDFYPRAGADAASQEASTAATPEPAGEPEEAPSPEKTAPAAGTPESPPDKAQKAASAASAESSPGPSTSAPAPAVALRAANLASGARVRLPLPRPAPAAIFTRAGTLWFVLDGRFDIDLSSLKKADESLLRDGRVQHRDDLTIIRIDTDPAFQVIARRDGATWEVDLTLYPAAPTNPLKIARRAHPELGPIVMMPLDVSGRMRTIADPVVGDTLTVVPLLSKGRGVVKERRFSEFVVLKSAQGVAVQMIAEHVSLSRLEGGIAVRGARALSGQTAGRDRNGAAHPEAEESPSAIVDFDAWKQGNAGFREANEALLEGLAAAEEDMRNRWRFKLAKFYVGRDMAAEALGYLRLMADADPAIEKNTGFLAVRGIARFRMGRLDAAGTDLEDPDLDDKPHIALWRARVAAAREDWEAAYRHYRAGLDVLTAYDEPRRARFQLAGLKAARKIGDMETAKRELALLNSYKLPPAIDTKVRLVEGGLLNDEGNNSEALAAYSDVISGDYRPTRVLASLARVKTLLSTDGISREEAITELERLRYIWRGDAVELEALEILGRLYVEAGQYRKGLSRMRTAVTHFNDHAESRKIAREMGEVFKSLFLKDAAKNLTPIRALALYYDFRELTPIGHEGDTMIRRLADRLVKVDLLDKAAELLKHQVKFRLKGAAQAQVAANLAAVYLLDHDPQAALEIIRDTAQPQMPDDITRHRRYLEARALIELERFEDAERLLAGDSSHEALALKSDLFWGAKKWTKAANAARVLLGDRWQSDQPLKAADYTQILRLAVSLSIAGDVEGLEALRDHYAERMQDSPYARTFDIVTTETPSSGLAVREMVNAVADVSSYETYLNSYRKELASADAGAASF